MWSVFQQEIGNCYRSFGSSAFLEKTMVNEGGGGVGLEYDFFSYSDGLGVGLASFEL